MLLRPDYYVTDVTAIDLQALKDAGIKAILVDVDNTLLAQGSAVCLPAIAEWVTEVKKAGFALSLLSNNWRADIHDRVAQFECEVTARATKPLPKGFRAAAATLGVSIRECAVVGDQIFTDVLGGNLLGATTVLVEPLSRTDLPHTVVLRRIERLIMAGRDPETRKD